MIPQARIELPSKANGICSANSKKRPFPVGPVMLCQALVMTRCKHKSEASLSSFALLHALTQRPRSSALLCAAASLSSLAQQLCFAPCPHSAASRISLALRRCLTQQPRSAALHCIVDTMSSGLA
eukprot:1160401-Pelagomonas_calceolata.AAC.3